MTENPTDAVSSKETALARLRRILTDTTMPIALDDNHDTDTIYAARDGKYEMPIESGYRPVGTTDGGGVVSARPIDDDTIGVPIPDPFTVAAWHMHAGTWTLPDNYDPYAGQEDHFTRMRNAFEKFGDSAEHSAGLLQRIAATWGNTPPPPEEDPHDTRRRPGEVPKPKHTPPMWADVPGKKWGRNQRRQTRVR